MASVSTCWWIWGKVVGSMGEKEATLKTKMKWAMSSSPLRLSWVKWILDQSQGHPQWVWLVKNLSSPTWPAVERKGQLRLGGKAVPPSTVFLITSQTLIKLFRNNFRVTSKKPYFKGRFRDFKINSSVLRNLLISSSRKGASPALTWEGKWQSSGLSH